MSQARAKISSMTGYGRATARTEFGGVAVEVRSTNHRYVEIDAHMPNGLSALQGRIADELRKIVRRGRVEVFLTLQTDRLGHRKVQFDEALLQRYHEALLNLKGRFGLKGPLTLEQLLSAPQAMSVVEDRVPAEQFWPSVRSAVQAAARDLAVSRRREGAKLAADLRGQLKVIERNAQAIARRLPRALAQQRQRLVERLRELLGNGAAASVSQLEQAAALVKDTDVHEELVRLESHVASMRQTLAKQQVVGKRLDFMAQELMRETNTLGSKVNDSEAVQHVVEIKGCIEKIREQVQNLE
ncbi:MAG: YicC family protein [Candidatus Omnitrophica bacterium]|nr:YicC family protein [Candidatus Omnitrophota bacterium]